jgi:hypothetical protein
MRKNVNLYLRLIPQNAEGGGKDGLRIALEGLKKIINVASKNVQIIERLNLIEKKSKI